MIEHVAVSTNSQPTIYTFCLRFVSVASCSLFGLFILNQSRTDQLRFTRTHVAGYKLYPLVAVNIVSCIDHKIVASFSPVCCWIQRIHVNRDINE